MAVHPQVTSPVAAEALGTRRPPDVVDDEKIEAAVAVVVQPDAGNTPRRTGEAGGLGDIGEASASLRNSWFRPTPATKRSWSPSLSKSAAAAPIA
jgi:hypothetical protein